MSGSLRKHRSPLMVIFMTMFLDLVGFGIVLPLSPYYAQTFGATPAMIGLLLSVYSMMQFIFAPLWGRLSDRVGRRPVILISVFGGVVSYYMFATANALWVLFAARMFQGICGANVSTTQAYVADITTQENRSKGMGVIGAAFGLGFIFGPAMGAKLSELGPAVGAAFGYEGEGMFGLGFPALVASGLCLLNFLLAYFLLPESLPPEKRAQKRTESFQGNRFAKIVQNFRHPQTAWLLLIWFLASFAMGNMEATLALFTQDRLSYGVSKTGELLALVGVVMAFTQGYLVRKMMPRVGEKRMIMIGPFLSGLGLAAIGISHSTLFLCFAVSILALGAGMTNPSVLGCISLLTDSTEQGRMMGVTQSLGSLARFVGPICGGILFGRIAPGAPYFFGGFLMFLAVLLGLKNRSKVPEVHKNVA